MKKNILVYNNSTEVIERMAPLVLGEGMEMVQASTEEEMERVLREQEIHLLLIDVELEARGWGRGIELIMGLRKQSSAPIIIVSRQTAATAEIMALNSGADDYVTVDCNPLVLLAKVKAQIRRYTQIVNSRRTEDGIHKIGGLEVNDARGTVHVDGREVRLTPTEYKILRLLVQQKGKVLSITQIYESIWRMKAIEAENTVAVHIRHIREKIENNPKEPRYLKVVWGEGYKVG